MKPAERARVERSVASLVEVVSAIRLDGVSPWPEFCEHLEEDLQACVAGLYGFAQQDGVVVPHLSHFSKVPEMRARRYVGQLLDERVLTYDPLRIDPSQQNRVSTLGDLADTERAQRIRTTLRRLVRNLAGFEVEQQIRLLITEGNTLLAYVGAVTEDSEAFGPPARAILERLAPVLRERLLLEHRLATAPLRTASLDAALEALVEPAFVVGAGRTPALMNSGARALWRTRRAETRGELDDALKGDARMYRVSPVEGPGLPRHWLLVRRGASPELAARLAHAAGCWGLTPREVEVLPLVAEGRTNSAIARQLGSAVRTVELHVTHVMRKARASNRASLVAQFWTGRSVEAEHS